MKKRILLLTKYFLPHIGGVEVHVHKIAKELSKRGHTVVVVCANTEGALNKELKDGYVILRDYHWAHLHHKFFDIVHVHDFEQYIPNCHNQYITFHGYEGHIPPERNVIATRQKICKLVKGTIHVGSYLQKWYLTDHPNNINILGGVDNPHAYLNRDPQKPFKTAYIGRIAADKKPEVYDSATRQIESVTFKQFVDVPNEDVRKIWLKMDIAYVNGMLTMLEAMATGIPVVALANNPMSKDYIEEFPALMVQSEEEIVKETNRLINDPDLYLKQSYKGWEFAINNTWSDVVDKYEKLWGIEE